MEQIITKAPFSGFIDSRIGGRQENQDSFGYVETSDGLLVIVCDGMGGGPGGKTASSAVVDVVRKSVVESSGLRKSREEALEIAIERAHNVLLNKMQEVPVLKGMGTTIAALYINKDSAVIVHVGDSRVYKIRSGTKVFRTKDHSMVGEMVRNGTLTEEQARLSAQSNIITRAIGIDGRNKPDIDVVPFEKGDRFVLCSDGIWGSMPEAQLIKYLSERRSLSNIVESLSNKVDSIGRDNGNHHDNLTLAIVESKIDSNLKEKMNKMARRVIALVTAMLAISLIFNLVQKCSSAKYVSMKEDVEELQSLIQQKDLEISELKDSVNVYKQNEKLLQEELKNKTNLENAVKGIASTVTATLSQIQQNKQESQDKEKETNAKNKPSQFDTLKNQITNKIRRLLTINVANDGSFRAEINKIKKDVVGEINEMKRKCPDKKQSVKQIESCIYWDDIYQSISADGKLTESGKKKVNTMINNLKSIK